MKKDGIGASNMAAATRYGAPDSHHARCRTCVCSPSGRLLLPLQVEVDKENHVEKKKKITQLWERGWYL